MPIASRILSLLIRQEIDPQLLRASIDAIDYVLLLFFFPSFFFLLPTLLVSVKQPAQPGIRLSLSELVNGVAVCLLKRCTKQKDPLMRLLPKTQIGKR